jgi:uncharacterized protein
MSPTVLSAVFRGVFHSGRVGNTLHVAWHAGEPLVLPPSYYQNAFEICDAHRPKHIEVRHGIQTNGTLITDSWCEFIKENQVGIGVSLDGPARFHDANRRKRSGTGTYESTMRGIKLLQKYNIPFHIIAVLTFESLSCPDEFFEFFAAIGIEKVCFSLEEIEGVNANSSLSAGGSQRRWRYFFSRYLELLAKSASKQWVRELHESFAQLFSGETQINGQNEPFHIVSVDWTGNFSTFSPELLGAKRSNQGDFIFGNFLIDNLADLELTPKFLAINAEIQKGVEICRSTCGYFELCHGGAPSNKLAEHGTFASSETLYCRLRYKTTIDVLLEKIEDFSGILLTSSPRSSPVSSTSY